jgi:hypothetical protein
VCLDETSKQLIKETHVPIRAKPGDAVVTGTAVTMAPAEKIRRPRVLLPELQLRRHDRYQQLVSLCASLEPIPTAVVHPCDAKIGPSDRRVPMTGPGQTRNGSFWHVKGGNATAADKRRSSYRPGSDTRRSGSPSEHGHSVMTGVGRFAPISGVVDLSPRSIRAGVASLHSVVPASSVRKTTDRVNQKIDEQARTQRKLTSKRVQDVNRLRRHGYLRQHDA